MLLLLCLSTLALVSAEPLLIGQLETLQYGVKGEVFAVDDEHLMIKNFAYTGAGPDAFFWVGTQDTPSGVTDESTTAILTPEGKTHDYRDSSAPVLGRFDGVDVTLTMPPNMKVSDLKWISVWCRQFSVDFGNLIADFQIPGPASSTSLPAPIVPSSSPEPEPESSPEPEPESSPEPETSPEPAKEKDSSNSNYCLPSFVVILATLLFSTLSF